MCSSLSFSECHSSAGELCSQEVMRLHNKRLWVESRPLGFTAECLNRNLQYNSLPLYTCCQIPADETRRRTGRDRPLSAELKPSLAELTEIRLRFFIQVNVCQLQYFLHWINVCVCVCFDLNTQLVLWPLCFYSLSFKGIVHPKMKLCWKCPHSQAIQDADEFVSSSDL